MNAIMVLFPLYTLEGSAVSDVYKNDGMPSFMRYVPKDGEQVVYEDIYNPDVYRVK